MNYIIEFEIAAIMIQILLIVMYHVRHNGISENDKTFAHLLYLELVCSVTNIITVYTLSNILKVPLWFNYLVNIIYLLTYNISSIAVFCYIINVIGSKKLIKTGRRISYVLTGILLVSIGTTPWTSFIIGFDDGIYYRGHGMIALYLIAVSLLAMILFVLIVHRKDMNNLQFGVMMSMNAITIISIIFQAFFKNYLLQNFAITLSYCMLYICLQNPDDYMDKFTGCRNRKSFYRVIEKRINENKNVSLIGFILEDLIHTQTMLGYENTGKLINVISMFLMEQFGKNQVFHINDEKYIILLDQDMEVEMPPDIIIEAIQGFFDSPIHFEGIDWRFSPDFFEMNNKKLQLDEIKEILESVFYQLENNKNHEKIIIDDEFIEKIRDEKRIVRRMRSAVNEKSFEVYYQPIYHIKDMKFSSAEALVRLFDDDGRIISPEYFIPIAEKNGMILEIGEIVLEKVCSFMKSERAADQFDYIEINLSTVQCVRENLPEMIKYYTEKYQINPKRLNFEITETAEVSSGDILMRNMNKLCSEGYTFSLDDFGTGFSTALYLTNMPVDIVKIDKSILWNAMENQQAMSIMKNMIILVKQLKKKVLVEGIETEHMADVLKQMECDYLQGYLYSKPLAEKDIVAFLNKYAV